jgi:DNA-directed RNA polymerase specialized sigma24 family protein
MQRHRGDGSQCSAIGGAEVSLQVELSAETYSPSEVSQAIRELSTEQKTLLVKIAKAYVWKTSYGYEDLIQEAFARVLEGKRAWPRNLPIVVFLRGVMRSIASDWPPERHDTAVRVDEIGYVNHSAAARIDAQKMLTLFDDDPIAQKIFVAMLEGARGEELRALSGLAQKDYETKRTKMRRRLEKMCHEQQHTASRGLKT